MTWAPPKLIVKVALEKGPFDTLSGGDWTDLSDRVRGTATCKRGRTDVRSAFPNGSISILLDNSDRMLDPLNPEGLVYAADDIGLPLCPVTVDWDWDGDTYRAFTGFLGPECWQTTTGAHGPEATVELVAMDQGGYSPGLIPDPWGALLASLHPDWWLRMDGGFPVVADESVVPNRSGTGGGAFMYSPSGISRYFREFTSWLRSPALRLAADNVLISFPNDVMPDGDENDLTIMVAWSATAHVPTGESAQVLSMLDPTLTTRRWVLTVEDDGEAHVTTYDAGGTQIDTAMIDRTGSVVTRFDDGNVHLAIIRFTSGTNMDVWFGGLSPVGGTLTATSTVYESALVLGSSPIDTCMDELFMVRRALSDPQIDGVLLAGADTSGIGPWFGDDWNARLRHWYDVANVSTGGDTTDNWHMPVADPDDGLFGLSGPNPASLANAVQQLATWSGGAAWVTKEGYWRVRSLDALTDTDYDPYYTDIAAVFTDHDGPLDPGEYRHAGVTPTGADIDSVINYVEAIVAVRADPDADDFTRVVLQVSPRNDASIARFGIRSETVDSEWWNWATVANIADTLIERFAWPLPGAGQIHLDAANDADLTQWIVETCELELAVDVTYTPFGADPVTAPGLNIQSIDWSLDSRNLTCDLTVAKS